MNTLVKCTFYFFIIINVGYKKIRKYIYARNF